MTTEAEQYLKDNISRIALDIINVRHEACKLTDKDYTKTMTLSGILTTLTILCAAIVKETMSNLPSDMRETFLKEVAELLREGESAIKDSD